MNANVLEALMASLWPAGDGLDVPQVHMLLDGARDPAIAGLLRSGKLEYECLFAGKLTPLLQAAAPYLVHLAAGSALTRQLFQQGWGNDWGCVTVAAPSVTIVQQRLHFKKFLQVCTESGQELLFRFYDPRVLRLYLDACTGAEFSAFMRPFDRIVVPGEDPATAVEYRRSMNGRDRRVHVLA